MNQEIKQEVIKLLIAERYVTTEESAEKIIQHASEEWLKELIESTK